MNNKLMYLYPKTKFVSFAILIIFWMVPIVYSASIDLTAPSLIIQGENELMSISILTDTLFSGTVYLGYENIESAITAVNFDNNGFIGTGPYIYSYSWEVAGINPGFYSIIAELTSSGNTIATDEVSGIVNSSAPVILSKSPNGVVTSTSTTLEVTTDEDATCRYSASNTSSYDDMSDIFTTTGSTSHSQVISWLSEAMYNYYVLCKDFKDYKMNESTTISFKVDLPPSAEISLSDESPVKAGTIEVSVVTSENLETTPILEYSFNDAPTSKRIISLTGENSLWEGYMIIKEEDDNKVGTFHFSGEDDLGTIGNSITEGKIFLVDTSKPPKPLNIETIIVKNGDIKLKWYYEGEPVESFNIYRSTESGVDYIDFYASTDNGTYYTDTSTTNEVTYYYKVGAVDEAGNIGPLSEEVYATSIKKGSVIVVKENKTKTEEPKVLPPNLVIKVNDMIKKVEQLEIDVKDVSSKFESGGIEQKELIDGLGLTDVVNNAKSTINKLKNELEDLKLEYKTSSDLDFELEKVDLEVKRIRKTTPKKAVLIEKTEFIQSSSNDDNKIAVDELFPLFDEKQKEDYINKNKRIQKDVSIEVKIKIINIEYLDETVKEQTLIRKKISYLNPDPIEDVIVMEIIPKTIAESTDDINFKSGDYEILKKDPIVKWGFLKLDYEGKVVEYSIEKRINIDKAKEAKSIILIGPAQLEKTSNVVGYSILSFFKSDSSTKEKFGIWAGIIIIGLLSGYYLIIVKGNMIWIKEKIRNLPTKRNIKTPKAANNIIKEYPHLSKIKENEETSIYSNIGPAYDKLPLKRQKKDEFMVINELIIKTQEHLSTEDFDKAASIYPRIELLYKNLPKELKSEVFKQCVELQKDIREGNNEFYKSVL